MVSPSTGLVAPISSPSPAIPVPRQALHVWARGLPCWWIDQAARPSARAPSPRRPRRRGGAGGSADPWGPPGAPQHQRSARCHGHGPARGSWRRGATNATHVGCPALNGEREASARCTITMDSKARAFGPQPSRPARARPRGSTDWSRRWYSWRRMTAATSPASSCSSTAAWLKSECAWLPPSGQDCSKRFRTDGEGEKGPTSCQRNLPAKSHS
jgi:hypothetical protein